MIKQLAQAGVEIFEYMHGQSLTPKNYMDRMMSAIRAGTDEAHREQTSERVHEAHTRSVRAGHVVGGRVFGYRNQDVYNGTDVHGRPLRSHVERVIEPTEAVVVGRIFALYDQGLGLKRIAKQLMSEKAAAPKPFLRKDGLRPIEGWSPSTVRTVLTREVYHGVIVWNRSRKRPVTWGAVDQHPRPESEWLRAPAEHLRLIDEALWKRVQSRRRDAETLAARLAVADCLGVRQRPPRRTFSPGWRRVGCAVAG